MVGDVLDVGAVGIEGAAAPGEHVLVLLVGRIGDPGDRLWLARQDAKIAEAERQSAQLSGEALIQARRRIAALKRARTLGPAGLRAAAAKATESKSGA